MAKSSVDGNTKSSEVAEMKASKSATQSKSVEKSASVQESKTATGSTTVAVQKQSSVSKSSFSSSSSAASASRVTTSTTSSSTPFARFKELDEQNSAGKTTQGKPIFKFTNPALKTSASSYKDGLLAWCQGRTREYKDVKIENFSSSWSDGLAFCALIHHFYKDAFDFETLSEKTRLSNLSAKTRLANFQLAFRIADEKAGIYPLLDPEDMVAMGQKPDWKCVFTYVQSMYQKLKDM